MCREKTCNPARPSGDRTSLAIEQNDYDAVSSCPASCVEKHVKHKVTRFSEIAMITSMDAAADLTCGLDDVNIIMRRASVE